MKKTGRILKQAREEKGFSIGEISTATKISSRVLNAIESGNENNLPPKTFLRGFVQTYAIYLKLDVDEVMDSFHQEMGSTNPDESQNLAEDMQEVDKAQGKQPGKSNGGLPPIFQEKSVLQKALAAIAIVILIIIIISVKSVIDKYKKEADVKPPENIQSLPNPKPEQGPSEKSITEEKTETAKASETENSKESEPKPNEDKKPAEEIEKASLVANPPKQESIAEPVPQVESASKVEETKVEPKSEENQVARNHEVIIEALDQVEIEFRILGGELKRIKLSPDQIHTIKAKGNVNIDISDGGAVNIIHNGRDKGVPGDLGKPIKVRIR